jgi:hypothetical protein
MVERGEGRREICHPSFIVVQGAVRKGQTTNAQLCDPNAAGGRDKKIRVLFKIRLTSDQLLAVDDEPRQIIPTWGENGRMFLVSGSSKGLRNAERRAAGAGRGAARQASRRDRSVFFESRLRRISMPRKSAISLTVVAPALPNQRPAAPAELDDTERRVWEAITGALPPTWFDVAALQVLLRAVAQGAVCESLEAHLRTLRSQEPPDSEAIGALAAQHAAAAKSFTQLLTTLRATPHSRMQPHIAGRQVAKVRTVRPWEVAEETSSDG